eukprot:COSAG06_NODE_64720_length_258_cov_14.345912_1_plen_85_part_11
MRALKFCALRVCSRGGKGQASKPDFDACLASTAQHSTAQHSTAQHSAAQCSAVQCTRLVASASNESSMTEIRYAFRQYEYYLTWV